MSDAETDGEFPSLGLDLAPAEGGAAYRVLARKYRPATFDDLIGQDAMVRTLANAFEAGRIPQAWILTGVRGVGKTTTARILARALNYEVLGSISAPTVRMPVLGTQCRAIMESRHVDVIEMDAASHNGVDDVRQINEAVRYAPAQARYKVYILDEVHMLSTAAFNALLKTLEEPPPHVKFVFATTEIRKVPVTVLSRCQRFDLRRVDAGVLVEHLSGICGKENVTIEPEALALVARAAEGSVRDALSLLDQAIAHAAGAVRAEDVRLMLGLADRTRVIDLFDALMRGDAAKALGELRDQYDSGADPAVALIDLADFTHFVTRVKVVPSVAEDPAFAEIERTRAREFAAALSMRVLSRTWQMLLKGIADVQAAAKPLQAAEMVLVRVAYAADLPAPEDVVRSLGDDTAGGGRANAPAPMPEVPAATHAQTDIPRAGARPVLARREPAQSASAPAPSPSARAASDPTLAPRAITRFEELIALAAEKRDLPVKGALERDVRLVRMDDGRLEIALEPGVPKSLVNDLSRKLGSWTGRPWMVVVSAEGGAPTVKAQIEERNADIRQGVQAHPLVQDVLTRFPGAQITHVHPRGGVSATDPAPSELSGDDALPAAIDDENDDDR
jgi:DNA polymerase-3 subunit gamma/tau